MAAKTDFTNTRTGPQSFPNTHWSVVLAAGRNDTTRAQSALADLCQIYWYPLYAFIRRRGYSTEDAQDLTQGFFAQLLAHNWVGDANREEGHFRTFLLTALSRFLANEWDRVRAQKRGGGAEVLPFDTTAAESRYSNGRDSSLAPDQLYDRQWAMTLLDRALNRLSAEHAESGKTTEFTVLNPALTAARGDIDYAMMAGQLGMTETAVRMAVHRLRKRFRAVFREEIAQTVTSPNELEEEIRHLMAALSG
jgi:RNA polymerase sigma-70 factor (ECF subfamily)